MVEAKYTMIGMMRKEAWLAYRGNKVLCDALVRVRRFATQEAALKAGNEARPSSFY